MTNIFISERGILYRQPYQCSYMQTHTLQCWKICLSVYMLAYKVHYQTTALLQLCLRLHRHHSTHCFVWHNLHSNNTGLLSAYKHIRFHISNTCALYEGSRAVADTLHSHAQRQASEPVSKKECLVIQIRYQSLLQTATAMSPQAMWLLWGVRNTVKQFYWNHINDHRASTQHVPMSRQHSAQIQLVSLKTFSFFLSCLLFPQL